MSQVRFMTTAAALAALVVLLVLLGAPLGADNGLENQLAQLTNRVTSLESELSSLKKNILTNHPDPRTEQDAIAALQAINATVGRGDMAAAKPLLADFMNKYANTRAAKPARSLQGDLAVVGRAAPDDWEIERWYQGEKDIDLKASGPTIVVFWETWCPHCRREVPKLQKVYEDHHDRGLQILGLSRLTKGATDESVRKFMAENNLKFPLAKEKGSLADLFGVGGIPAVAVVKDQKVVWRGHPAKLTAPVIESLLQ